MCSTARTCSGPSIEIRADNSQREYYLTDCPGVLKRAGKRSAGPRRFAALRDAEHQYDGRVAGRRDDHEIAELRALSRARPGSGLRKALRRRPVETTTNCGHRPFGFEHDSMNDLKIFSGRANPDLTKRICDYLGLPRRPDHDRQLSRQRNLLQDRRGHPRPRRLPRAAHLPAGQRKPDGTADHDRQLQAGQRRADHGRDSLLRLRPAGSQGRRPRADHGQAGGQPDHPGRRRPRAGDGPARRPDPRILRRAGRPPLRRPGDRRPLSEHGHRPATSWWSSAPTKGASSGPCATSERLGGALAIVDKRRSQRRNDAAGKRHRRPRSRARSP